MSKYKIADLELTEETRTFGEHTTTYRIEHRPLVSVERGMRWITQPSAEAKLVGWAVKAGPQWTILFADGEVAATYDSLKQGCWNLVH